MEENKNINDEQVSKIGGGKDIYVEVDPEEYRWNVIQNMKTKGYCTECGAVLFRVNKLGDGSREEAFAVAHLQACVPYQNRYISLGGTKHF